MKINKLWSHQKIENIHAGQRLDEYFRAEHKVEDLKPALCCFFICPKCQKQITTWPQSSCPPCPSCGNDITLPDNSKHWTTLERDIEE